MATRGSRGPVRAIAKRDDQGQIIGDLITMLYQQSAGVLPGEDKLTLRKLSDKYRISSSTLQRCRDDVQQMLEQVQATAALVGVTQVDMVAKHVQFFEKVQETFDRARRYSDENRDPDKREKFLRLEMEILERLYPLALDRLQQLVPAEETDRLTGFKAKENDERMQASPVQLAVINGAIEQSGKRRGEVVLMAGESDD